MKRLVKYFLSKRLKGITDKDYSDLGVNKEDFEQWYSFGYEDAFYLWRIPLLVLLFVSLWFNVMYFVLSNGY